MIQKRGLNQMTLAAVSGLPLFYGSSTIGQAAFLAGSVLASVFIFEVFFHFTRSFWLRSLRPLLALIILASVLSGIFLVCSSLLLAGDQNPLRFFSLTLASAFLLAHSTVAMTGAFQGRAWKWIGFSALLLVIGICRQWSGAFQMFPPASFWLSGMALGVFLFLKQRVKAS